MMNAMTVGRVTILMATYNGAKYLRELLDSILNQSYSDWDLVIRDDCSSDQTPIILNEYAEKDRRIKVNLGDCRLGPTGNFAWLVNRTKDSNYIMFCDQDDVWLPDKISKSLEKIRDNESKYGKNTCQLVFGEKVLVDEHLNRLNERMEFQSSSQNFSLWQILIRNPVYGCTMIINRSLADKAGDIPEYVQTHDYYYSLCAALYGMITKIDDPLLLYRQHVDNVTGGMSNYGIVSKIKNFTSVNKKLHRTLLQNYSFCKDNERTDNNDLRKYLEIIESPPFRRIKLAKHNGFSLDGKLSTYRLLWALFTYRTPAQ